MTATVEKTTLWSTRPGWGIAADLIPPELINSRQLSLLRKLMAAGLVLLLLVCAGGYYLARRHNNAASSANEAATARTIQLQNEARQPAYVTVTKIEGTVAQVESQIATVMTADVDLVALMKRLRTSLPARMSINQESLTISGAGVAGATGASGTTALDKSGLARIGNVTLGGTGQALTDLAAYVDRLSAIPGLVDVTPVSNSATKAGTVYSLTIGLTSALLSHRFDQTTKATK